MKAAIMKTLQRGIHIPKIEAWMNYPLRSWHHGERVDPANWPWWILFRLSL